MTELSVNYVVGNSGDRCKTGGGGIDTLVP